MGQLENGKAAGKDEVTGEMIKGGGNDGGLYLEAVLYGLLEWCCAGR